MMTRCQTVDKPLMETITRQFTDDISVLKDVGEMRLRMGQDFWLNGFILWISIIAYFPGIKGDKAIINFLGNDGFMTWLPY